MTTVERVSLENKWKSLFLFLISLPAESIQKYSDRVFWSKNVFPFSFFLAFTLDKSPSWFIKFHLRAYVFSCVYLYYGCKYKYTDMYMKIEGTILKLAYASILDSIYSTFCSLRVTILSSNVKPRLTPYLFMQHIQNTEIIIPWE